MSGQEFLVQYKSWNGQWFIEPVFAAHDSERYKLLAVRRSALRYNRSARFLDNFLVILVRKCSLSKRGTNQRHVQGTRKQRVTPNQARLERRGWQLRTRAYTLSPGCMEA